MPKEEKMYAVTMKTETGDEKVKIYHVMEKNITKAVKEAEKLNAGECVQARLEADPVYPE